MKTKVLHLANVGGQTRGGGVHEVAYNFFMIQKSLNIKPSLWFPGTEEEKQEFLNDDHIRVLETYGNPNFGIIKELFNKKALEDFDIIHQHGIWLPTSLLSKRYRVQRKVPILIHPHGYLEPFRLKLSKIKKKIASFLYEKQNLASCNLLIACAKPEAENLRELFPNKEIAVIPNGIPTEFMNQSSDLEWDDPFPNHRKMLFLSRIHPLKGLVRFLKILKSLDQQTIKDWKLIIAGFSEVDHEQELKKLTIELGLQELVKFVGPQFGQKKVDLISHSDLFVLPTFNENYGIVVAEALAREVPVLTTKGTPWGELETHNCGFWADNNDEGIKKSLIDALSRDRSELKKMGQNGKQLIIDKYTWEKTTLLTEDLYNWVLNGGQKPDFIL